MYSVFMFDFVSYAIDFSYNMPDFAYMLAPVSLHLFIFFSIPVSICACFSFSPSALAFLLINLIIPCLPIFF